MVYLADGAFRDGAHQHRVDVVGREAVCLVRELRRRHLLRLLASDEGGAVDYLLRRPHDEGEALFLVQREILPFLLRGLDEEGLGLRHGYLVADRHDEHRLEARYRELLVPEFAD